MESKDCNAPFLKQRNSLVALVARNCCNVDFRCWRERSETRMICICFRLYPSRSCMRGLPRLRSVLNSKLNPPATFNYLSILSSSTLGFNFWGSKTVFLGIVDVLKVAASPCTWLHGCRPAAPPLKRQPRRKGSSTAPRGRDAASHGRPRARRHRRVIVRPPGGRRQM